MKKTYLQRTNEETRILIQELATKDGRTVPAEIHWLVEAEIARRNNPELAEYLAKFERAPREA